MPAEPRPRPEPALSPWQAIVVMYQDALNSTAYRCPHATIRGTRYELRPLSPTLAEFVPVGGSDLAFVSWQLVTVPPGTTLLPRTKPEPSRTVVQCIVLPRRRGSQQQAQLHGWFRNWQEMAQAMVRTGAALVLERLDSRKPVRRGR